MLSKDIRDFCNDLERTSEHYCMSEVIDKLDEFEKYATELEEQIDDLRERLEQYEEED